mgnify:CR=1 FL=1
MRGHQTTNDYIKVKFKDNEEFKEWTDMLIKRSAYDFKTKINENDNVLTLSTCYNKDEKVVFIIDECHRSQAGEMRRLISKYFNNAL